MCNIPNLIPHGLYSLGSSSRVYNRLRSYEYEGCEWMSIVLIAMAEGGSSSGPGTRDSSTLDSSTPSR